MLTDGQGLGKVVPAGQRFPVSHEALARFCERNGILKLSVFGSALGDSFHDGSDLDLLVEFDPHARVGLVRKATIQLELEDLVGRQVDLRTPAELSRYFRQAVLDSAMHVDDAARIRHMLDAGREAVGFIAGTERSTLDSDRVLALALLKCIETVGGGGLQNKPKLSRLSPSDSMVRTYRDAAFFGS